MTTDPFQGTPSDWLALDEQLLRGDDGWRRQATRDGIELWKRRFPDDPNDVFRWRLTDLPVTPAVAQRRFVDEILEHHRHWTAEFRGGHEVRRNGAGDVVLYQHFAFPPMSPRDLCHRSVTKVLESGAILTSHRSTDDIPAAATHERIRWWGASLVTPGATPGHTTLDYLDRENQAGWVPAWLMNPWMPKFLHLQATAVRRFFAEPRPESSGASPRR